MKTMFKKAFLSSAHLSDCSITSVFLNCYMCFMFYINLYDIDNNSLQCTINVQIESVGVRWDFSTLCQLLFQSMSFYWYTIWTECRWIFWFSGSSMHSRLQNWTDDKIRYYSPQNKLIRHHNIGLIGVVLLISGWLESQCMKIVKYI